MAEKFLVLWRLDMARLSSEAVRGVMRMREYGARLETDGKVVSRYHIVGAHGGAWIYSVDSHEDLDRQLALAPVYNFASYQVLPLAEMEGEPTVLGSAT